MKTTLSLLFIALALTGPGCGNSDSDSKQEAANGDGTTAGGGNAPDGGEGQVDQPGNGSSSGSNAPGDDSTGSTAGGPGGDADDAGVQPEPILARTEGIGRPCETDDECESGQTCRVDTTDYIAHGQCTVACASSDACKAEFGEETMCIGAEICVALCLSDADCPEQTECIDAGWCKRQGPDSGVPSCTGVATPCSLLSGTECDLAIGCFDESDCGGFSESCYSQYSSYACNEVDGCYWSSSGGGSCSGVSSSCSGYFSEFSCGYQPGCSWNQACGGTASKCEDLPASACTSQPGCSLDFP